MTVRFGLAPLLLLSSCVMFDTTPARLQLRILTDEDTDGYTLAEGDCNDHDPAVHPDAVDDCDGADTNCDGRIDEAGLLEPLCRDDDGDGHGDPETASVSCELAEGRVALCDDCDDRDPAVSPAASERCDAIDNNCDGAVDGEDSVDRTTWFRDLDEDGYGDDVSTVRACEAPEGYIPEPGDCDDRDEAVHPGVDELCGDGVDTNCDGDVSQCGFWGDVTLDPEGVSPSEGGFIRGAEDYEVLGGQGVQIVDTLSDGTGDVLLLTPYLLDLPDRVDLWYSAPLGALTSASAHLTIRSEVDSSLGACGNVPVVDVDEDGRGELLLCAPFDMEGVEDGGRVFSVPVGSTGDIELGLPDEVLSDGVRRSFFGRRLAGSENIVGSGAVVVGSYAASSSTTDVGLVRAYQLPLTSGGEPVSILEGEGAGQLLGYDHMVVDDLDADGVDDLVVTVRAESGVLGGSVRIFRGPLASYSDAGAADAIVEGPNLQRVGFDLSIAPDLDDDGVPELLVGSEFDPEEGDPHLASWLPGGLAGSANVITSASLIWTFDEEDSSRIGMEAGDMNGDGELDILVGASGVDGSRGAVFGYYGPLRLSGREEFAAQSSFVRRGEAAVTSLGGELDVGDVNADGTDDLLFFGMADPSQYVGGAWFLFGEGI